MFFKCSYATVQTMERKHTCPVSRDDLVFSVDMALRKAERFWPKKRGPGDHDRLRPFAEMIVDHLELCGMRCFRRPLGRGHSTPDPWGGQGQGGKSGGPDG